MITAGEKQRVPGIGIARGYLHRLINQLEIREDEDKSGESNVRDGVSTLQHRVMSGQSCQD